MNPEFFTLHKDLPREGPGEPSDVEWAVRMAETPANARILDAACGPGADTLTLAQTLPNAQVLAVEMVEDFANATKRRIGELGDRVQVKTGDMFAQAGPFDLIWCATAAYFSGVQASLTQFSDMLSEDGVIAFSEVIWLSPTPPPVLVEFWQDYAAMTDLAGTRQRIADAGMEILGERILSEDAWDNYYEPLEARISYLEKTHVNPDLAEVIADHRTEIDMRRQFGNYFGYALFVVRPTR